MDNTRKRYGKFCLLVKLIKCFLSSFVYFWATVCKNGSPYPVGPLSVCPVCDVGALWPTVGWIRMPLGMGVGLGPGDIVLDGDPVPHGKEHNRYGPKSGSSLSGHVYCGQTVAHLSNC